MPNSLITSTPVKGSWEDLLLQADTLADQDDDACIAVWQKIITRLDTMPDARLAAGEGHLRQIRINAADSLQLYFDYRQRYDEAIEVLEQLTNRIDPDSAEIWNERIMSVLRHGERIDELIGRARTIAERAPLDDLETWGDYVNEARIVKRFDVATLALSEIERRINRARKEHGSASVKEDSGYLAWLRAQLAVEQGLWDEGSSWFQYALTMDPLYTRHVQMLYTRMILNGGAASALSLIERESDTMRAAFWRGLAQYRLGKAAEAERIWRSVTKTDLEKNKEVPIFEWILSYYFLPDMRDAGLAMQLGALREAETPSFLHHTLAGLGFALRHAFNDAHIHLANAQTILRRSGQGRFISKQLWFAFNDLLDETTHDQFRPYFQP